MNGMRDRNLHFLKNCEYIKSRKRVQTKQKSVKNVESFRSTLRSIIKELEASKTSRFNANCIASREVMRT